MNYDIQSSIQDQAEFSSSFVLNDSVLMKNCHLPKSNSEVFSSYLQRTTYIETVLKTKWIGQNPFDFIGSHFCQIF